jgi:hypothetical protein
MLTLFLLPERGLSLHEERHRRIARNLNSLDIHGISSRVTRADAAAIFSDLFFFKDQEMNPLDSQGGLPESIALTVALMIWARTLQNVITPAALGHGKARQDRPGGSITGIARLCEAKWRQVLDVMSDGVVPRAVLRAGLVENRPFGPRSVKLGKVLAVRFIPDFECTDEPRPKLR